MVEGVELVCPTGTWIGEPAHGNQVSIGGLDNAPLTQSFLSGSIELVFTTTNLSKDSRLVFIPCVASVQTPGGVFAAEVENHTFLCGREVMLTAVPTFLIPEHRPIHVNGVVDA